MREKNEKKLKRMKNRKTEAERGRRRQTDAKMERRNKERQLSQLNSI